MTEADKRLIYQTTDNNTICEICGKKRGNHRATTLQCPIANTTVYDEESFHTHTFYDSYFGKYYYSKINEELSKIEVHLYSQRARQRYGAK